MGADQLADSWLGEPETVDTDRASGDDGTAEIIILMKYMHLQLMISRLIKTIMVRLRLKYGWVNDLKQRSYIEGLATCHVSHRYSQFFLCHPICC